MSFSLEESVAEYLDAWLCDYRIDELNEESIRQVINEVLDDFFHPEEV